MIVNFDPALQISSAFGIIKFHRHCNSKGPCSLSYPCTSRESHACNTHNTALLHRMFVDKWAIRKKCSIHLDPTDNVGTHRMHLRSIFRGVWWTLGFFFSLVIVLFYSIIQLSSFFVEWWVCLGFLVSSRRQFQRERCNAKHWRPAIGIQIFSKHHREQRQRRLALSLPPNWCSATTPSS